MGDGETRDKRFRSRTRYIPEGAIQVVNTYGAHHMMRRFVFETEDLRIHVRNRLRQAEVVREGNRTFLGRLINRISTVEGEKVRLDGLPILQLHELTGWDPPNGIQIQNCYDVSVDLVRAWYDEAFPDAQDI